MPISFEIAMYGMMSDNKYHREVIPTLKSMVDELTQLKSRNALNERVEKFSSEGYDAPKTLGVVWRSEWIEDRK